MSSGCNNTGDMQITCKCCNNDLESKLGSLECDAVGAGNKCFVPDTEDDGFDLIQIRGVCPESKIEELLDPDEKFWTQIYIPEVLCIPPQKPDVEQIMSISACVDIISQKVVKTPVALNSAGDSVPNNEGLFITGKKLIIEGILRQKVIYTADVPEQSVHAAHFDVPFSAFIILDADVSLARNFDIDVCIEDIFVCRVSKRQIFKNVTIFLKATPIEAM